MRIPIFLVSLVLILSSCSTKVPVPIDSGKGIAAIPVEVRNSTSEQGFPFYYVFTDYERQADVLTIRPYAGQKLALTGELEPGEYQLYKVTSIYSDGTAGIPGSNKRTRPLRQAIKFTITPGTIAIGDRIFTVHKYDESAERGVLKSDVEFLGKDKKYSVIEELKNSENGNQWAITSEN